MKQQPIIVKWLSKNEIDLKLEIVNGTIYLGSVTIDDILHPKTRYKKEDNGHKKNTISNIVWKLRTIYSNIKFFISGKIKDTGTLHLWMPVPVSYYIYLLHSTFFKSKSPCSKVTYL